MTMLFTLVGGFVLWIAAGIGTAFLWAYVAGSKIEDDEDYFMLFVRILLWPVTIMFTLCFFAISVAEGKWRRMKIRQKLREMDKPDEPGLFKRFVDALNEINKKDRLLNSIRESTAITAIEGGWGDESFIKNHVDDPEFTEMLLEYHEKVKEERRR